MEDDIYITDINTIDDFLEVYEYISKDPNCRTYTGNTTWKSELPTYIKAFKEAVPITCKLVILLRYKPSYVPNYCLYFKTLFKSEIQENGSQTSAILRRYSKTKVYTKTEYLNKDNFNKLSIF